MGVIQSLLADDRNAQVVILPSGMRADKTFSIPEVHRIEMIRAMVEELREHFRDRIVLDLYFAEHPEIATTTYNEYHYARGAYGESISHVFGTDVLDAMVSWWDLDKITGTNTHFVAKQVPKTIFIRPGYDTIAHETSQVISNIRSVISLENQLEISSTHVREHISTEAELFVAVPASVARYILAHQLYNFS